MGISSPVSKLVRLEFAYFEEKLFIFKEDVKLKKFENSSEVFKQLRIMFNNGELVPADYMSPDYKTLYYDCACGKKHILASTKYVLCAKGPVRFFFICENSICTLVSVKGFFKQASAEEWFVDSSIFLDAFALALQ